MKNEKIKIICDGVNCDTRNITDILLFTAERAEWTARNILENLPTDEPERSSMALEAHRNFCLLDTMKKDRACASLLPDWFRAALSDAVGELQEGLREYIKRYPQDRAAKMLTSGAAPTLRFYLASALEDYDRV